MAEAKTEYNATMLRIGVAKNGNEYIVIAGNDDSTGVVWVNTLTEEFRRVFTYAVKGQIFTGGNIKCAVENLADPDEEYAFYNIVDIDYEE